MDDVPEFTGPGVDVDMDPHPEDDIQPTVLDELRSELSEDVKEKEVTIPVPERPGYSVRYGSLLDHHKLQNFRKRAKAKDLGRDVIEETQLASLVLQESCRGILRNGSLIVDDQDEPVLLGSRSFVELMGGGGDSNFMDKFASIRKFYGRDADIISTSGEVLVHAGYAAEMDVTEVDPTG